jgi:hypothetical protein
MPIVQVNPTFRQLLLFRIKALLKGIDTFAVFLLLLATWFFAPGWLRQVDGTVGSIDQSIWLLVVLSLISFMLITALCWWLLKRFWLVSGLPPIGTMVSQFNTLKLWQQLGLYLLSFALLLLAALGSLVAIC